jgi:hypothetical protein
MNDDSTEAATKISRKSHSITAAANKRNKNAAKRNEKAKSMRNRDLFLV